MSSRSYTPVLFFGLLGIGIAGAIVAAAVFAWPRADTVPDNSVLVRASNVPEAGDDPVRVIEGRFWLVNLLPGEGTRGEFGVPGPGGLLALSEREVRTSDARFVCASLIRSKGSLETSVRIRVSSARPHARLGPAVDIRAVTDGALDTFDIRVNRDGSRERVNTSAVTTGVAEDNALRAVAYRGVGVVVCAQQR